jgi:eukaryotic-like serine/threonine-protein kinase
MSETIGKSRTDNATYRCVCGDSVELHPRDGGTCPSCRRHYCASILTESQGEETVLVGFGEARRGPCRSTDPADDPLIGTQVGHYRIEGLLGRGGMGAVYQAVDESLQRFVALKVIRDRELSEADSPQVQQLFQEARAQARVNHPNVVHIYFVGKSGDSPYFAMELIDGPTLADRLRDGPLEFHEVARIALQIAGALKHASRYDIVHGDIKPSNILQVNSEHVKLSDFGLARRLSELQHQPGRAVGTPNYISPEAAAGRPTDFRSDMYSLGVTLFELTFGRLPYQFESGELRERLQAHLTREPEFPQPWPQAVPQAWSHVLERLLAKRPEDRYADYDEFILALKKVQPLQLPSAGRVQRGLAWLVDNTFAFGAQAIVSAPLILVPRVQSFLADKPLLRVLAASTTFIVPALILLMQCRLGQSLGKRLFQIRVVDSHGLPPPHAVMAPRSVFQFLIVWGIAVLHMLRAIHLDQLAPLLSLVCMVMLIVDLAVTFVTRKRRSLHDLIFGTEVVLDAAVTQRRSARIGEGAARRNLIS